MRHRFPLTIVIEGPDNSGKSTLAEAISGGFSETARPIWITESPGPQSREELNKRARDWVERMTFESNIYVRHPCISEGIYGPLLRGECRLEPGIISEFYAHKPLIIYCDPGTRGLSNHVLKEHDTPEHVAALQQRYDLLLEGYRAWAMQKAFLWYRIGDPVVRIKEMLVRYARPSR